MCRNLAGTVYSDDAASIKYYTGCHVRTSGRGGKRGYEKILEVSGPMSKVNEALTLAWTYIEANIKNPREPKAPKAKAKTQEKKLPKAVPKPKQPVAPPPGFEMPPAEAQRQPSGSSSRVAPAASQVHVMSSSRQSSATSSRLAAASRMATAAAALRGMSGIASGRNQQATIGRFLVQHAACSQQDIVDLFESRSSRINGRLSKQGRLSKFVTREAATYNKYLVATWIQSNI